MRIVREVQIEWNFIDWEMVATLWGFAGPRMSDGRFFLTDFS